MLQGPEHSSARLERFLQMVDENPYHVPEVDQSKWFGGGHLGAQTQQINQQARGPAPGGSAAAAPACPVRECPTHYSWATTCKHAADVQQVSMGDVAG